MARRKSIICKQEVVGEPTRARCGSVAATSASPSALVDRGKRRAHTASYQKEKQQGAQDQGVCGRRSSRNDVQDEKSHVPVETRSSRGVVGGEKATNHTDEASKAGLEETTTSQRPGSSGADRNNV
ncbi:hypothetical protein Syun_017441 [Stephania yunnanensis]|uniref:Uncharacterized protein n=1 Tax=Stephania yunnanensis TaxID=152371 RepID=A0AAP0J727_9MAGN